MVGRVPGQFRLLGCLQLGDERMRAKRGAVQLANRNNAGRRRSDKDSLGLP